MFLTAAAPNKHLLGATNGLTVTVVTIQHMVGSPAAALLFAFLLGHNYGKCVKSIHLLVSYVLPMTAPRPHYDAN
jgi:hypothetical protein